MDLLWFVLIGLCAGWLAGQLTKTGPSGWWGTLVVGVIGAILGGFLLRLIGFTATGMLGNLLTATLGAIILIAILKSLNKSR